MQTALFKKYGFVFELIDREYRWNDILAIMTEQYLSEQGIMKATPNTYKYTHSSRVIQETDHTGTINTSGEEIELNMMQQDSPNSGPDDIEK